MRIGIIGAGQLGQMLGFAARNLGHTCRFLDPSPAPPAAVVGPVIEKEFDDHDGLAALASWSNVVTYEFENVPVHALQGISDLVTVYPPIEALRHAQDRLAEKHLFEKLGIPLPEFRPIDARSDLADAIETLGLPLVVKTRRLGYDGKGQFVLDRGDRLAEACDVLGTSSLSAEQWVDFDYEVSALGVRSVGGEVACYPLTRNEHAAGILRSSRAPVDDFRLTDRANQYLRRLLEELDYVGVLALEFFVVGDTLLANEFAPRVHNSGHWTIEGSTTSQFSNHIRAITGQNPASTASRGHVGMVNLIGEIPPDIRQLEHESCWVHDYGKVARRGRKLGHITVVSATASERDRQIERIMRIVTDFNRKVVIRT